MILQGAERELPASFTYILIFPRGKGGKEDSAAAAKILLFFFFLQHLHTEYASANNCYMAEAWNVCHPHSP